MWQGVFGLNSILLSPCSVAVCFCCFKDDWIQQY
ncbi:unnamed protein product [Linum tenue]|uniref:Uncharacterized protein n=1 Tax=Linum tenue TaxID=586396 RepID=A0AAV0R0Y9_9ROSI|nr:unnamed protein product [Linum tenue]